MDASTLRLGFLVGVLGLISLLLWRDRENVERKGILFFRRTEKGIDLIDKIAKKAPRFWNVYAWMGVAAAFISMIAITYIIGETLINTILTGAASESFGLVAPGTGDTVSTQPGVTFVPAEYWFISIAIIMVVHELSHGIIARLEDFEINSVGVLVLGIIPGAFVEPEGENMLPSKDDKEDAVEDDEEEGLSAPWDQGDWKSRLKVLAAGTWANYVTGAFFLAVFLLATTAMSGGSGNIYYTVQDSYPAAEAGMTQGKLLGFNGSSVDNVSRFAESAQRIEVNETYSIETSEGSFNVTATEREGDDTGYIGVRFSSFSPLENWFSSLLSIIAVLNIGIGMFNMLPAKPLDGGHILDTLVERFAGDKYRSYVNMWSLFVILVMIGLLAYSIIGPF